MMTTHQPIHKIVLGVDVKTFFILVMFFTFLTFFIFQTFFILKNVGKVQSSKQINKKHFRNNSDETDL